MSAGNFVQSKYQAAYDDEQIHPIKVQPETLGASIDSQDNVEPSGATTSPISAKVSGSRRQLGLTPRKVTLQFTGTTAGDRPTGYAANSKVTIPALTSAFWDKCKKGNTGTYLGKAVKVVSISQEYVS